MGLSHPVLAAVVTAVVVASVFAFGRWLRRWVFGPAFADWFRRQVAVVVEPMLKSTRDDIMAELRPNDGSSLRDQVDSIEQAVTDLRGEG